MITAKLRSIVKEGLSVAVGTVDAEGFPACCRAFALTSTDDFETVTVFLPVATSQVTVANVATTRRVAITCSEPLTHNSLQIKGLMREVRLATAAEEPTVQRHLDGFAGILAELGLPEHITRSVNHWPAFAIEVSVEEVFDQTPGPKAGAAIQ